MSRDGIPMGATDEVNFPALVRRCIDRALTDEIVRDLCFDYFPEVYRQFSGGMSRTECIRRLVEWCHDHHAFDLLLEQAKSLNAVAYSGYADRLESVPDEVRYSSPGAAARALSFAPCMVHPLPPAPDFVGRERELKAIEQFWDDSSPGSISLAGLGGAGKTAIAAHFLDALLKDNRGRPAGLFVWSFYVNQDANAFLDAAYHYFSGGRTVRGHGAGTSLLLFEALNSPQRFLIVLDGLERMQRERSDKSGYFGELKDPLLKSIVNRLSAGLGATKCLITTRFPLPELETRFGKSFLVVDIDQLERADARLLLRRHGVKGDDTVLDQLIAAYGSHALTLDHLGGYLSEYADGDPAQANRLPEPEIDSDEPQERSLARVLHAYDAALSPEQHGLLARLCIFRFGTTLEQLHAIFAAGNKIEITGPLKGLSIEEFRKILKHLLRLHLALEGGGGEFTAHPAVRDHFYRAFADTRILHQAIRRHFSSLVRAPGTALPTEPETIDLLEELIYHTLQAGDIEEAREIYHLRLGTYQYLAWNLGQYSRCIRILTQFPRCPDPGGLIWCYRALGNLKAVEAEVDPDDTWWLSMIACLRGRLREVVKVLADSRQDPLRIIAEFLTGVATADSLERAPIWAGLPITLADCYLRADRVAEAKSCLLRTLQELGRLKGDSNWNDEVARLDIVEAEIARRAGNPSGCRGLLEKATQWVLQSGSQEHLCALQLGKARLAIDEREFGLGNAAIDEGLHIADECNFGFYSADLRIARAELRICLEDYAGAHDAAMAARNGILGQTGGTAGAANVALTSLSVIGADHPSSQYVWATTRAGFLQGSALAKLDKPEAALQILRDIQELQRRIGDPQLGKTQAIIASLG
jgi:hypothetical protein